LNPLVVTLRRQSAACACAAMIDRPAFREFGKIAEKWRDLAEKRRDYFFELYRSGRWRLYHDHGEFLAQVREVAQICDRWAKIVERHRQAASEPDAPAVGRDAA
jgi:uncharacterized repeat protein (TIGR03809 family)